MHNVEDNKVKLVKALNGRGRCLCIYKMNVVRQEAPKSPNLNVVNLILTLSCLPKTFRNCKRPDCWPARLLPPRESSMVGLAGGYFLLGFLRRSCKDLKGVFEIIFQLPPMKMFRAFGNHALSLN